MSPGAAPGPVLPTTPLVSVVIPAYNHVQYIGECIDSVLSQDHAAIEVIVVEDRKSVV